MTRSSSSIATFFRTLPDTLQQPTALAMIGSVGAHLLVFATLPAFTPATDNPDDEVRRVQIVDLPQRQEVAPPAASGLGLPPVPKPSANPQVQPSLPPVALNPNTPPNPLYTIPDLPAPPQTPPVDYNALLREYNERQRQIAERQAQAARNSKPQPPKPQPQQPQPSAPKSNPPANSRSPGDLQPADPSKIAANTPPTPDPEAERLAAATRFNPERTNPREVQTKYYGDWLAGLAQRGIVTNITDLVIVPATSQPTVESPYPALPPIPQYQQNTVSIYQLVDKTGKPIDKPVLIGSTGYKLLDDYAISLVQKQVEEAQFGNEKDGKVRAYKYEYKFKAPPASTATTPPPPPK